MRTGEYVRGTNLNQYFAQLIAEAEGIAPREVTTEWIHWQREERIYPTRRYLESGKICLTRREIDELIKSVRTKVEALSS